VPKGHKGQKRPADLAAEVIHMTTPEEHADFSADDGKDKAAQSLGWELRRWPVVPGKRFQSLLRFRWPVAPDPAEPPMPIRSAEELIDEATRRP
jgi:hypothetical protein